MSNLKSEQILDIVDLSHDGRGVGRLGSRTGSSGPGKTCFVTGALPGERVRWQRTNSKSSYDEGYCTEVVQASPDRIEPRCSYFSECGGCELQHLQSEAQVGWKQRQLEGLLGRAGLDVMHWAAPVVADAWHYRRRTRLAVAYDKAGRAYLGYRARRSNRVVDVEACAVLDQRLNALLPTLGKIAASLKSRALQQMELSAADTEMALCLELKQPLDEAHTDQLRTLLDGVQLWQKLPGKPAQPVGGFPALRTNLIDDLHMDFAPGHFVQINAAMNRAMIGQALDWLAPEPHHRLLDLYSGAGNFSIAFASHCGSVLGVEGSRQLCDQATDNAKLNKLENLQFCLMDLDQPTGLGRLAREDFDLVLLDPPRSGAAALMPGLIKLAPERMLYISCHPATMVRDLQMLAADYRISRIGVLDMFPHTAHLEAMALLEPR